LDFTAKKFKICGRASIWKRFSSRLFGCLPSFSLKKAFESIFASDIFVPMASREDPKHVEVVQSLLN